MLERITNDPDVHNGRACIRDTGIRVGDVLRSYADGLTSEEIIAKFPILEETDLKAALLYAAERLGYHI